MDVGGAVVDQDIHRSEAGFRLADEVFELVQPAHVTRDRHDLAAQGGEFVGRRLKVLFLAAGDDDAGAGFGQTFGNGLADAATAPGHQGHFPFQRNGCAHGFSGAFPNSWPSNGLMRCIAPASFTHTRDRCPRRWQETATLRQLPGGIFSRRRVLVVR